MIAPDSPPAPAPASAPGGAVARAAAYSPSPALSLAPTTPPAPSRLLTMTSPDHLWHQRPSILDVSFLITLVLCRASDHILKKNISDF